jgi:hypothetical protein
MADKENTMIRINLTDQSTLFTTRHTKEQVLAAKDTGMRIQVGGTEDLTLIRTAERTIDTRDITLVEEVMM